MEFLCNTKITVEAQRQKKKTSFNAQDVNLKDIQKHNAQNHMHALNAQEAITRRHVQIHHIHRPNVHCAEEIILQVTRDAKCTRTCKKKYKKNKTQAPMNQIIHRPLQQRIHVNESNKFPPINPTQTQNQMPFAPQPSYSQVLNQNQQSPHIANHFSTLLSSRLCSINSLTKTV
jgi:hypothetical protein